MWCANVSSSITAYGIPIRFAIVRSSLPLVGLPYLTDAPYGAFRLYGFRFPAKLQAPTGVDAVRVFVPVLGDTRGMDGVAIHRRDRTPAASAFEPYRGICRHRVPLSLVSAYPSRAADRLIT